MFLFLYIKLGEKFINVRTWILTRFERNVVAYMQH